MQLIFRRQHCLDNKVLCARLVVFTARPLLCYPGKKHTHTQLHTLLDTDTDCSLISYLVHHLIDNEVTLEKPQLSPDLIPKLAGSANLLVICCVLQACAHLHTRTHTEAIRKRSPATILLFKVLRSRSLN